MTVPINVSLGFMCRHTRTTGFKIAIVVGYPANLSTKLRVRYWRAASKLWTQPTLVEASALVGLNEADYEKHRHKIKQAAEAALAEKLTQRVWS